MPLTEEQIREIRYLEAGLCSTRDAACAGCIKIRAQIAAIQAEGADGAGMDSEAMMPVSDG